MEGRSKRILIGCGIGCGAMILMAVVAAIAFGTWISGKGELLEPQRLLGADTTGYAEWTFRLEDPGTEGFVQLLIETLEAERSGQARLLPDWLRGLVIRSNQRDSRKIRALFPVLVAWTLSPGDEAGEDEMLLTVSPSGMGNRLVFADWLVGLAARWSDEGFVERYRDEKIYRMPSGRSHSQTFFLRGGTIFFTTDLESARVAVDRLQGEDPARRQAGPLDPLFGETSAEQMLRGALTNDRGEAPRIWREISGDDEDDLLSTLRGVSLEGGLRADGSLAASIRFHGPGREWARTGEGRLRDLIESALSPSSLEVKVGSRASGDVVQVDVRVEDIIGTLQRWFDEQQRRSGVRIKL